MAMPSRTAPDRPLASTLVLLLSLAACEGVPSDRGRGGGDRNAGVGGAGGAGLNLGDSVSDGTFDPQLECAWDGPAATSAYAKLGDVVSMPVVINLTDDDGDGTVGLADVPDIAVVTYQLDENDCTQGAHCGCCNSSGVLRVLSGRCSGGTLPEHFTVGANEIEADTGVKGVWLDSSGGLATGDIDADGSVDIVATTRLGGTIAFERDGRVKWYQPGHPKDADHLAGTQPAIADIDADGVPEVIQGRVVLAGSDGSLKWKGMDGLGTNGFMGPVSALADLDVDGRLNLLAGDTVYEPDGSVAWTFSFPTEITPLTCDNRGARCDGFTAAANFDADLEGELIVVRAGMLYIVNHDGSPMERDGVPVQIPIPNRTCPRNEGGPPTVADFDGDGEAEIGVAGADYYIVADLECLATPLPTQCSDTGIRWKVENRDCSSRVTGSSVFDFEGDGRAEVVYADENSFRILDGINGAERVKIKNHSHTRLEMPIVVDVDSDGQAEIVFIENGTNHGIRVWGDGHDAWVPTRRVWNQHSYHVTNVTEEGHIPQFEAANWLQATDDTMAGVMNNFRQNLPDVEDAPPPLPPE